MNEEFYVNDDMLARLVEDMLEQVSDKYTIPEWCEIPDPSDFLTDEDLLIEI